MTEHVQNAEAVFLAAMDKATEAERNAYVDAACAGNVELLRQVRELLASHDATHGPLDAPPPGLGGSVLKAQSGEVPGTLIGPYKLLQQIGEGGMGVVFMAEQTQPVQRKVALKIIKPGMDSKVVIARFEAERQALAMMDHVNIARVLDGGTTQTGRPYFVMDLIHGIPITRYCDDNHLTPQQRLELFTPVCQAIQHAHQKGIIHRDIKPSNVLITLYDGKPVPKVIDFGVAKATEQKLTERTLFTNYGTMVGTLEYMSPEQAEMSGLGVDTRSDIYSLGVMLYELLTGSTPLDRKRVRAEAYAEILRIIKEEEPPRPSTRLSDSGDALASISAQRQMEPAKLTRLVRGELDWIVMKSLEKDRNRRYETASGLAQDIHRYLADEAVLASPPSTAYRFKKFIRRNKRAVIATVGFAIALIAGIIGTTIGLIGQSKQRVIAEEQRAKAQKEASVAQAVAKFQAKMLRAPSPFESGDKVTVVHVMRAALKELDAGKLKDQPVVESYIREMIGRTLHDLGLYAEGEPVLRKALVQRRIALPDGDWAIASCIQSLAITLQELGQLQEAEALMREALQIRRTMVPIEIPELIDSLGELGTLLQVAGKYPEAEPLCREALEIDRQRLPAGHLDIANRLGKLGWVLQVENKFSEAETLCREALDIRRRNLPPAHPDVAESLNHLAVVLARSKRLPEAEPLFREMLEIDRKSLPAGHPRIGQSLNNLASALQEQGKFAEAEPLQREGLKLRRDSLPAGHPYIAQSLKNLATLLSDQGKFAEAEPLAREALAIRRKALPAGHPDIAGSLQNVGAILKERKKFADGEAALLEAMRILDAVEGLPAATRQGCVEALVRLYSAWNQAEPGKGHDGQAEQWKIKLSVNPPIPSKQP